MPFLQFRAPAQNVQLEPSATHSDLTCPYFWQRKNCGGAFHWTAVTHWSSLVGRGPSSPMDDNFLRLTYPNCSSSSWTAFWFFSLPELSSPLTQRATFPRKVALSFYKHQRLADRIELRLSSLVNTNYGCNDQGPLAMATLSPALTVKITKTKTSGKE